MIFTVMNCLQQLSVIKIFMDTVNCLRKSLAGTFVLGYRLYTAGISSGLASYVKQC